MSYTIDNDAVEALTSVTEAMEVLVMKLAVVQMRKRLEIPEGAETVGTLTKSDVGVAAKKIAYVIERGVE